MEQLKNKVRELLENKSIDVFIGYGEGTAGRVRAIFIRTIEQVDKLIFDERCNFNLAGYLTKHEVKHLGKIGILASIPVLRSILVLASEEQFIDGQIMVFTITSVGNLIELPDFKAIKEYVAASNYGLTETEKETIAKLDAMTTEERWIWWQNELNPCFKCYACRQACPMCYCARCTVEQNQPQWIHVPAHDLGNLEWHMMRAMHLTGRCINCGECAKACPLEIPINLLTYKLVGEIENQFSFVAGVKAHSDYVLSTYKPDDKENFIL